MIRVFRISNWRVRYCLKFEWGALPIGFGMTIASPIHVANMFFTTGGKWWLSISFAFIGWLLLLIGLCRPVHRRLGIDRRDWVQS